LIRHPSKAKILHNYATSLSVLDLGAKVVLIYWDVSFRSQMQYEMLVLVVHRLASQSYHPYLDPFVLAGALSSVAVVPQSDSVRGYRGAIQAPRDESSCATAPHTRMTGVWGRGRGADRSFPDFHSHAHQRQSPAIPLPAPPAPTAAVNYWFDMEYGPLYHYFQFVQGMARARLRRDATDC